jgi:ATP synthase protein I
VQKRKFIPSITSTIPKPPILQRQLFLWFVMGAVAVVAMQINFRLGLSFLWGFSVCMLPAICFTWYATKNQGKHTTLVTINNFYRAETIKVILTAILFVLVFKRETEINTVFLFIAFVVAQISSSALVAITLHNK